MNKRIKFIIILLGTIITVSLLTFFYGGCNNTSKLKQEQKEFDKLDKEQIKKEDILEKSIDSISPIQKTIKNNITTSQNSVERIKATRNEERHTIINLPDDEQAVLMSSWISEIDTFR